jgi:2-polyprenyl-3-methyl-5-hydroxy-6-metoxy-1,4-benzoquinol methylase
MNERIKELILQSVTFRLDPDSECYEAIVCPEDLEHLAELIVQECLKIVEPDMTSGDEWCVTLNETAQSIRQHFGVEQ